jgi:hypothetical protein
MNSTIEERLSTVEREIAQLRTLAAQQDAAKTDEIDPELARLAAMGVKVRPKYAWKKSVGWAKDCPGHDEAMRLGAEWRAEVNRQSLAELDRTNAAP